METSPDRVRTPAIHISNSKGGVGKTALVVSIGTELAQRGYRTLLVDLDPQSHTTKLIQKKSTEDQELGRWERYWGQLRRGKDIRPFSSKVPNLSYLPGDYLLVDLEYILQAQRVLGNLIAQDAFSQAVNLVKRYASVPSNQQDELEGQLYRLFFSSILDDKEPVDLSAAISESKHIQNNFDIIIFDTAPTASQLMVSALAGATHYIPVTTPSDLSIHGTQIYEDVVATLRDGESTQARRLGVLVNQRTRNIGHDENIAHLRDAYGDYLFDTMITYNKQWDAAMSGARTAGVTRYLRTGTPKREINQVVTELLDRLRQDGWPVESQHLDERMKMYQRGKDVTRGHI